MKHEPRSDIHMEKPLLTVNKLGGMEPLWISRVGQSVSHVDRISDIAPACQLCGVRVQKKD